MSADNVKLTMGEEDVAQCQRCKSLEAALRQQQEMVARKDERIKHYIYEYDLLVAAKEVLEAENANNKEEIDGLRAINGRLEAALRQQKDECERFHKPA